MSEKGLGNCVSLYRGFSAFYSVTEEVIIVNERQKKLKLAVKKLN